MTMIWALKSFGVDFARGGFYKNAFAWSSVASVNLIRHPTNPSRFLVPAHVFTKIKIAQQTNVALYMKTKSGVAWIDNTVDTFVKNNERVTGVSSGSSNLNIYAGYGVTGDIRVSDTTELDRTVAPIFARHEESLPRCRHVGSRGL